MRRDPSPGWDSAPASPDFNLFFTLLIRNSSSSSYVPPHFPVRRSATPEHCCPSASISPMSGFSM